MGGYNNKMLILSNIITNDTGLDREMAKGIIQSVYHRQKRRPKNC